MLATSTPLVAVALLAGSVWVGSLVCLAVVTSAARTVLDATSQVAFFRSIGRRYAYLGTGSLLTAIGCGLAIAWPPSTWTGALSAAVALSGLVVVLTCAGMAQARAMTKLRRRAAMDPDDQHTAGALRRGKQAAGALRGAMALATLAAVVLVAQVIAH